MEVPYALLYQPSEPHFAIRNSGPPQELQRRPHYSSLAQVKNLLVARRIVDSSDLYLVAGVCLQI